MNIELLKSLGIAPGASLSQRRELLEGYQMSLLSARKMETEPSRIQELTARLQQIDDEIRLTKKELEGQQADVYEKQQYKDKEAPLQGQLTTAEKIPLKKKTLTAFRIAGPILLMLGFLYWFGGLHPEEWENNKLLEFFPNINQHLIIPIKFVWIRLDRVVSIGINGKFGVQLIAIAFILILTGKPSKNEQEKYTLKSLYTISIIISIIICVWHGLMQLIEDNQVFEGMLYYVIVLAICYAIGRIIGSIIKKAAKL